MAKNAYVWIVFAWGLWLALGAYAAIQGAISGPFFLITSGVITLAVLGSAAWFSLTGRM